MKKSLIAIRSILTAVTLAVSTLAAGAADWNFATLSDADRVNLNADTDNWSYDSGKKRWGNKNSLAGSILTANGQEIDFTKGLLISATGADQVRIDPETKCLTINNKAATITIPALKAGDAITVSAKCSSKDVARYVVATNVTPISGFSESAAATSSTTVEHSGTVTSDGDVTLSTNGGMYFYSIKVKDGGTSPVNPAPAGGDHSVKMNTAANQMYLTTTDNTVRYYNTSDLNSVDIDKATGKVTVTPKAADWTDEYLRNVSAIAFSKAIPTGSEGDITNRGVNITEAKGWLESVYAKWEPYTDATSYNVYVKGGKYSDYTLIEHELVRDYGTYCRADVVGLPAGDYSLKVTPVVNGAEVAASASEAARMAVLAHDRSGFAFHKGAGTATYDGSGIGAYKENGELKDNARVIYVSAATAKTVKCLVKQSNKDGDGTEFTGIQSILTAYQKGYETRPLAVRIIGTIRDTDLDRMDSSAEGIQIKGKNNYSAVNITIEGIGEDATTSGFGFLIRNCMSVEFRNFANMLCMDDCLSFDTANAHCWVHHMDFFYGKTGGDSDQAKGDGTVDIKSDSKYVTIAYNHFWDNGKTSLCGMKSETGPNYIDYHHNWFDHSDSRHPRIRTMSVHVWNNYYDGVAKYGVGAAQQSCAFVENNFFRNSKNPMLISRQGTDISSDAKGTFSGEDGGIIKSFGNLYAETANAKQRIPVTFQSDNAEFDCYEATTRDERVPDSVKAKQGGKTYDNFDTDPALMHTYTPIPAAEVPAVVTGYYGAGRLNKGDFRWTFDNAVEDANYGVISALKTALGNYTSKLVKIF